MRKIRRTTLFRRDYKREVKGRYGPTLDADLIPVLKALLYDMPLSKKYCDHNLSGEWRRHRECHIKPDLLLIYRKHGRDVLELVRLGSHAQLFERFFWTLLKKKTNRKVDVITLSLNRPGICHLPL